MATTLGSITLLDDVVARLGGETPSGRMGLSIHSPAGYVGLVCRGHLTPGLSNVAEWATSLWLRGTLANYPSALDFS